jgi:glycosyltransferase involved in cell wall biosynthesis
MHEIKKVLFVATVVKKHINAFHLPYIKMFHEAGWEVSVCARNDFENKDECEIPFCDIFYDLPFERFPLKRNNLKVFYQLKKLVEEEKYDIIHCHTPTGGMLTRIAGRKVRKNGTTIIYTAHGFHFYKGSPLLNWMLYFPIEYWLSKYTDILITINEEDYHLAQRYFRASQIEYVPGVGIDIKRIDNVCINKSAKRQELGIGEKDFVILSVGEVNKNKNQALVVKGVNAIGSDTLHYIICGKGPCENRIRKLSQKLKIEKNIRLVGFRNDVIEIYKMADAFVFPSKREGLSLALMEAMASGLPCIVSDIRGNRDLIENNKGGIHISGNSVFELEEAIRKIMTSIPLRQKMRDYNIRRIQEFSLENVSDIMKQIYRINKKEKLN